MSPLIDDQVVLGVLYTCEECGLKDREVKVRARGSEDVVTWVENICIIGVAADHLMTSPRCRATHMTNLKIPISGADKIGGVIKQ